MIDWLYWAFEFAVDFATTVISGYLTLLVIVALAFVVVPIADYIKRRRGDASSIISKVPLGYMRSLQIIGAWSAIIAIVFGGSYWAEHPKYHFERVAIEVGKQMPGSRVISSFKSGDLASPVSWFWPATTTWNFAVPDRVTGDRFYIITMVYGEKEAIVHLVDANCEDRDLTWYDLNEPASAFPARDIFGEPVLAPSGQTYRLSKSQLSPPPPGWMHEFCDTDWAVERKAASLQ